MALTKIPSSLLDTSGGFDLQGNITLGDNEQIQLGADGDLKVYHSGTNSFIKDQGTGSLYIDATNLYLRSATNENFIYCNADGAVTLYHDDSPKIATSSAGATVTGTLTVTGDLDITGNVNSASVTDLDVTDKTITLGAGQTEALSDGSGIIVDGSNASILWDETNTEFDINNSINVTGTVIADGLTVDGTATFASAVTAGTTGTGNYIIRKANVLHAYNSVDSSGTVYTQTYTNSDYKLVTDNAQRLRVANNGDISIYEDTGTTARLFWDASEERFGVGTSSPDTPLHIESSSGLNGLVKLESSDIEANIVFVDNGTTDAVNIGCRNDDLKLRVDAGNITFFTGSAGTASERMRIDSSGNVGIGIDSPSVPLDVDAGTANTAAAFRSSDARVHINFYDGTTVNPPQIGADGDDFQLRVGGGSEAMRIDSSGNVLVGKTSPLTTSVGAEIRPIGFITSFRNSDAPALFARGTDDGDVVVFRKDSTTVGVIGTKGADLYIGTGVVGIRTHDSTNSIRPTNTNDGTARDAAIDLGASNVRFKDLYLSGGTYLGGTGSANYLDDYEEGTFTPTVNSGSASINWAKYTKIGDLVYIVCELNLSGTRTATTFEVGGLPFTNGPNWTPCAFYVASYSGEGTEQVSGAFRSSSNTFRVVDFGAESVGTDFGSGYFSFAGTYKIN